MKEATKVLGSDKIKVYSDLMVNNNSDVENECDDQNARENAIRVKIKNKKQKINGTDDNDNNKKEKNINLAHDNSLKSNRTDVYSKGVLPNIMQLRQICNFPDNRPNIEENTNNCQFPNNDVREGHSGNSSHPKVDFISGLLEQSVKLKVSVVQ